jgi:hypothetical protein
MSVMMRLILAECVQNLLRRRNVNCSYSVKQIAVKPAQFGEPPLVAVRVKSVSGI